MSPTPLHTLSAGALQRELNLRSAAYAARHGLPFEMTAGVCPSLVFSRTAEGDLPGHGNFHPASYGAISANPAWMRRLEKPHTGWKRAWTRSAWQWRELDCAVSSDALLMNIFCYPCLLQTTRVAAMLGVEPTEVPEFGVCPGLALLDRRLDPTEVDMQLGDLLVEAKLTETGFQKASPSLLDRYTGWREVMEPEAMPRGQDGSYLHYQLIREVLSAAAGQLRFCLLCDSRRADLVESWFSVVSAVRHASLRCRLMLLTWQELAAALPPPLRRWLAEKYGIDSPAQRSALPYGRPRT